MLRRELVVAITISFWVLQTFASEEIQGNSQVDNTSSKLSPNALARAKPTIMYERNRREHQAVKPANREDVLNKKNNHR